MRLLLDENMSLIDGDLTAHGIPSDHIDPLRLKGIGDGEVFQVALEHGYEAVVTKDHYRQRPERTASLRAMAAGLRIFRLTFSPFGPAPDADHEHLRLILAHRDELERAVEPSSRVRLLIVNANEDRVVRRVEADEIAAGLRRLDSAAPERRR